MGLSLQCNIRSTSLQVLYKQSSDFGYGVGGGGVECVEGRGIVSRIE
jgi:hypothetical protein